MQGRLSVVKDADGPGRTRNLDHLICVMGDDHELVHCWSPQDRVISGSEVHHIKKDPFGPKVTWQAKGDEQLDLP